MHSVRVAPVPVTLLLDEGGWVAQTERHDAKREAVAEATWSVIRRVGLAGASMREIAREAGCTTGVLTHYFRGKDELLLFAFSYAMRNVAERMTSQATSAGPARARLLGVLAEALPTDDERRVEALVYFGFLEAAMRDKQLEAEFSRRYQDWERLVAGLVAEALGTRSSGRVRATTDLLLAVVDGIAVGAIASPERYLPSRQSELLRTAVDQLLPS
jgi:AcrR family transcriptional regulator